MKKIERLNMLLARVLADGLVCNDTKLRSHYQHYRSQKMLKSLPYSGKFSRVSIFALAGFRSFSRFNLQAQCAIALYAVKVVSKNFRGNKFRGFAPIHENSEN